MNSVEESNNEINLHPFADEVLKAELERRGWIVAQPRSSWLCRHGKHDWSRWSPPVVSQVVFARYTRQTRTCHRCGIIEERTC